MTCPTGHFISNWIQNVFWIQRAKVLNANPDGNALRAGYLPFSAICRTGVSQQKDQANRIKLNFVKEQPCTATHSVCI